MKSVVRILIVLACLIAVCGIVFWVVIKPDGYPFKRTITDNEGRMLSVLVLGRIQDTVYFESLKDQKRYDLPISSLITKDQVILRVMPENELPPKERVWGDNYIINRERRIKELRHQYDLRYAEMEARSYNDILNRSRANEMKRIKSEILELESDIKVYKLDIERREALQRQSR